MPSPCRIGSPSALSMSRTQTNGTLPGGRLGLGDAEQVVHARLGEVDPAHDQVDTTPQHGGGFGEGVRPDDDGSLAERVTDGLHARRNVRHEDSS